MSNSLLPTNDQSTFWQRMWKILKIIFFTFLTLSLLFSAARLYNNTYYHEDQFIREVVTETQHANSESHLMFFTESTSPYLNLSVNTVALTGVMPLTTIDSPKNFSLNFFSQKREPRCELIIYNQKNKEMHRFPLNHEGRDVNLSPGFYKIFLYGKFYTGNVVLSSSMPMQVETEKKRK